MLDDIKKSLLEPAKTRLPDIPQDSFYPDPPKGEYARPFLYLSFKEKVKSRDGFVGTITYNYLFDVYVGNKIDKRNSRKVQIDSRSDQIESAFIPGESLDFYHYVETQKYRREGKIKVKTFKVQEGGKERKNNTIRAELIVTF